LAIRK